MTKKSVTKTMRMPTIKMKRLKLMSKMTGISLNRLMNLGIDLILSEGENNGLGTIQKRNAKVA